MKKFIVVWAVATLLVAAPAAFGKSTKLEGKIKNDVNSVVKAKSVVDKHGTVTKFKGLQLVNVDYLCESGTSGEKSIKFDPIKVYQYPKPGTSKIHYTINATQLFDAGSFTVKATSNRTGTKLKGSVNLIFREFPGDDSHDSNCLDLGGEPGVPFNAKRK